jgi:hypothetical protein
MIHINLLCIVFPREARKNDTPNTKEYRDS